MRILLGILVLGAVGGTVACILVFCTPRVSNPFVPAPRDAKEAAELAAGRYYNERYGFSLALPEGALVREQKEGGTGVTVRIENAAEERGFQVFVVPYDEPTITDERFNEDIPSHMRAQEEPIQLDGVAALAFVSHDNRLGDLREVWAIRDGYLYEITSLADDELWLSGILLTWKFEDIIVPPVPQGVPLDPS